MRITATRDSSRRRPARWAVFAVLVVATSAAVATVSPPLVLAYLLALALILWTPTPRLAALAVAEPTVDAPEATADPVDLPEPEPVAEVTTPSKKPKGRSRLKAKEPTVVEPPAARWIRVGPGQFVRVEGGDEPAGPRVIEVDPGGMAPDGAALGGEMPRGDSRGGFVTGDGSPFQTISTSEAERSEFGHLTPSPGTPGEGVRGGDRTIGADSEWKIPSPSQAYTPITVEADFSESHTSTSSELELNDSVESDDFENPIESSEIQHLKPVIPHHFRALLRSLVRRRRAAPDRRCTRRPSLRSTPHPRARRRSSSPRGPPSGPSTPHPRPTLPKFGDGPTHLPPNPTRPSTGVRSRHLRPRLQIAHLETPQRPGPTLPGDPPSTPARTDPEETPSPLAQTPARRGPHAPRSTPPRRRVRPSRPSSRRFGRRDRRAIGPRRPASPFPAVAPRLGRAYRVCSASWPRPMRLDRGEVDA